MRAVVTLIAFLFLGFTANGQTAGTVVCPTLNVTGPSGITNPGDSMTFTVSANKPNLSYEWTVSAGKITSGQGTATITVATTKDMGGQSLTAVARVIGVAQECESASETAGILQPPLCQCVLDEFGKATDNEVKARLDNFFIQINNNLTAQGYIANYGTPAQIKKRKAQIMKAIQFRDYDWRRVTFVVGPDKGGGVHTKFYLVPPGVPPPMP